MSEATGSSPRSRGTHRWSAHRRVHDRFIPAIAGNTPARFITGSPAPVHPRDRGEHFRLLSPPRCEHGSSPRSRGTQEKDLRKRTLLRFIPAIAGNTRTACRRRWAPPVHPRDRGEHSYSFSRIRSNSGSSPRSRGTLKNSGRLRGHSRFIPAIAGNT